MDITDLVLQIVLCIVVNVKMGLVEWVTASATMTVNEDGGVITDLVLQTVLCGVVSVKVGPVEWVMATVSMVVRQDGGVTPVKVTVESGVGNAGMVAAVWLPLDNAEMVV